MDSKKEFPKLQFFSVSTIERMDCEITRIISLLQSERVTYSRAFTLLHQAKSDTQDIYYFIQAKLSTTEQAVRDLKANGRFHGPEVTCESFISLASKRALVSMRGSIDAYKNGLLTKRALRRQHKMTRDLIDLDVIALNQEFRDVIRKLKPTDQVKEKPWQEIPEADMLVKKVHPAHDDLG